MPALLIVYFSLSLTKLALAVQCGVKPDSANHGQLFQRDVTL